MQRHGRRYVPLHRGRRLDGRLPLRSDGQKLTEKSLTNSWTNTFRAKIDRTKLVHLIEIRQLKRKFN